MGGSPRVRVVPGVVLPDLGWAGELASLTEASPYLGPTWLAATEKAMPELLPWHTIATRARGELALTAGYILAAPGGGRDPRTYLGWQPPAGAGTRRGDRETLALSAEIDALGAEPFFPALLLGSPMGYRTEVAYNFWTRSLMAAIVGTLVPAAFDAGVRCVIAPWIPDRRGNEDFVDALTAAGGHSALRGHEDYVRLDSGGWDEHVMALQPEQRSRLTRDSQRAAAAGVAIERVDGSCMRPHIAAIAELACMSGLDSGAAVTPSRIAGMLSALLDAGADVRAYLGRKEDVLTASCVGIRKNHRLYVTCAGFRPAAVGDDSAACGTLLFDASVRDAYAEGLRTVEFGSSPQHASMPRGCVPRAVTTVMVLAEAQLREPSGSI